MLCDLLYPLDTIEPEALDEESLLVLGPGLLYLLGPHIPGDDLLLLLELSVMQRQEMLLALCLWDSIGTTSNMSASMVILSDNILGTDKTVLEWVPRVKFIKVFLRDQLSILSQSKSRVRLQICCGRQVHQVRV